jgi:hypothetical protein
MSEVKLEGGHPAYESGDGVVVTLMADVQPRVVRPPLSVPSCGSGSADGASAPPGAASAPPAAPTPLLARLDTAEAEGIKATLRMEIRYEVEAILAHRGSGADLEYEVKWAKWREPSWEPKANIAGCTELLEAYLASKPRARPKKKAKKEEQHE